MRGLRLLRLAAGALAAMAGAVQPAAAGVTVRVAPDVVVRSDEISLGDLARIEGDEPLARRLRQVWLGPAPPLGATQRLDQSYLRQRLAEPDLEPQNVRIIGPEQISVTRAFQVVSGAAVVEAAGRQIQERLDALPSGAGTFAVVPLTRLGDIRVPTGAVDLSPQLRAEPTGAGALAATVAVNVDGRTVQSVPLAFRADRYGNVVVAARALDPKTGLAAGDWQIERRPSTEIPSGALASIADGADLEPVRPIRPGEVLTAALVRPRMLVRRGELVTLVVEGPGFRITTQGVAATDGRRGEVVRIINPTSKRESLGRAEQAGLVRIPFKDPVGAAQ